MAKAKKQSVMDREKNRKGKGTLSPVQLISVYIAAVLIVILCMIQASLPEEPNPHMYIILALLAGVYVIYITIRDHKAKKAESHSNGPRLK